MKDETKMDSNRLITEIYKRPALWNQRHISYHNRDVTNRMWMEMATLFKLPKQVLKTKWKGLRDTFRAEIKKEQVYRKSNYTPNRPVWTHFKTLQFLKEQMLPRPPIWDRSSNNNSRGNETTSAAGTTSEDSCSGSGKIGASDNIASDRRKTSSTATKDNRRANKRLASCHSSRRRLAATLVDSTAATAAAAKTTASEATSDYAANGDLSPAAGNSATRHSNSDTHCRTSNSNTNRDNDCIGGSNDDRDGGISAVKQEPVDHYEENGEEFGSIPEETNMSTEELLINETPGENCVIAGQFAVDPLEANRFDDNYYFLMSLLPHIRALPAERRMLLRMQMQQLVYQEVYNRSGRTSSLSTFASQHPQDQRGITQDQ